MKCYFREALIGLYTEMQKLTEDLISTYTIRQKNFQEIQKSLEGINVILKSAGKLRGIEFVVEFVSI